MKDKIINLIKVYESELVELSEFIYHNPELGLKEFKSSKAHINLLEKYDFQVEENFLGFETAFKAVYKSKKPGPSIAYLAEYDALPEIGHGCGHNLLGATSTGAGLVLKEIIDEVGGEVVVLGSPAEENFGIKVDMAERGVFDNIDLAMSSHPGSYHEMSGTSSELLPLRFSFRGKTAHAAGSPEKGVNALDASIFLFNSINALREHLKDEVRIHGVITEGGRAANVVPDLSISDFYLRTTILGYMDTLKEKVTNSAKAAALATGCELEISVYEKIYKGLVTNNKLSEIYEDSLKSIGIEDIKPAKTGFGSSDMGDVSQVCPTIHPNFPIINKGEITAHTVEFRDNTLTDSAYKGMKEAIYALVKTAYDIIVDEKLLKDIQEEFNETFKK